MESYIDIIDNEENKGRYDILVDNLSPEDTYKLKLLILDNFNIEFIRGTLVINDKGKVLI